MQTDTSFELDQIFVCPGLGRLPRNVRLEISSIEQCGLTLFAKPNIHIDQVCGGRFFGGFETLGISSYDVGFKKLTRRDAQSHIAGTASVRITTDNPPASPAVMSPKGVAREVLLTEGTSRNARIVLPTDNCLFQSLSLIILPCHREQLGCTGMYLIGR